MPKAVMIDVKRLVPGSQPTLVTSPDLHQVDDLPAAVTPDGAIVSCWRFGPKERAALAAGADLFLFTHTGGQPFQPISLVVANDQGPVDDAGA